MEQIVQVCKVLPNNTAQVLRVRESACSGDCHKCSGCGASSEVIRLTVDDPIGVAPGDMVTIWSESAPVLGAAAVLFVLPLVLFYVGFYLGALLGGGALGGGIGFGLGLALAVVYDRLVVSKKRTTYTITGYANIPQKRGEES